MKIENSSSNDEILQNKETPTGQALTPEQLAQIEADKLALQSEYTRTRQSLIETTAMVAKNDPSYLASIKDTKLQNSVVKQLYGFDTYAQAAAVLGDDFNAVKDGNETIDKTEMLEREIKLMKYNNSRSEIEGAIRDFKLTNPQLFLSQDAEDKLRNELQFVSGELPAAERIRRASVISFSTPVSPSNQAYQVLNTGSSFGNGNMSIDSKKEADSARQKQIEAGRILLKLPPISQ